MSLLTPTSICLPTRTRNPSLLDLLRGEDLGILRCSHTSGKQNSSPAGTEAEQMWLYIHLRICLDGLDGCL